MNSRLQVKKIGAYSEDGYKVDSDFLVERRDIFDSSQIEFEEDEQDRELVINPAARIV